MIIGVVNGGGFHPFQFLNFKFYFMYKPSKPHKTTIRVNQSTQGETIEQKVRRIVQNKEPISDGAPIIFTERKDGVRPEYNIRTDRFELAVEAMDKVATQHVTKRGERLKAIKGGAGEGGGGEAGGQSIGATGTGNAE